MRGTSSVYTCVLLWPVSRPGRTRTAALESPWAYHSQHLSYFAGPHVACILLLSAVLAVCLKCPCLRLGLLLSAFTPASPVAHPDHLSLSWLQRDEEYNPF